MQFNFVGSISYHSHKNIASIQIITGDTKTPP